MPRLAMAITPARLAEVCDEPTRALLNERFDVAWGSSDLDPNELRNLLAGADVVVTSWGTPPLPTESLGAAVGGPRVVAHAAGSVKRLMEPAALERVDVFSAAPRIAATVGEYCLAVCLSLLRQLPEYDRVMRAGGWRADDVRGRELRGRRVSLIGASSTARAFLRLLRPFDVDVCVYDPHLDQEASAALGVRLVSLEEAMTSEIVSVHVPAVPETEGMISAELLALMPNGGVAINSSRAAAVDQDALVAEALSGRLRVAVDVFDQEPSDLSEAVRTCPAILLSPHIAGDSLEGHRDLTGFVVKDVLAFLVDGRRGPAWLDPLRWSVAA
ncbi:MAG: hydroxyacid dehydrogenase [Nocardioidaceae bacterium]